MRTIALAIPSVCCLLLAGCPEVQTTLHVVNPEPIIQDVRVDILDKNGQRIREVALGNVAANQSMTSTFKSEKDGQIRTVGRVPNSAIISRDVRSVLSDPFEASVTLNKLGGEYLDDDRSMGTISGSFKKLGADTGVRPTSVADALKSNFGALIVYTPAVAGTGGAAGSEAQVHYRVPPEILGVKVTPLEEIKYADTHEGEEVKMTGSAAVSAAAKVPVFGSFGFNFSNNTAYSLRWSLDGFGPVNRIEDPAKSPAKQIAALPAVEKTAIVNALRAHPGAQVKYITTMYAIKAAQMGVKEGRDLKTDGEVSAGSVITVKGAYTFSESVETTKTFRDVVLGYDGNEVSIGSGGQFEMINSHGVVEGMPERRISSNAFKNSKTVAPTTTRSTSR